MNALTFTASEIAVALGVKRQTIQSALRGIAPDGRKSADGILAGVWSIARLPQGLRTRLQAVAAAKNYRNPDEFLASPISEWQPAIPMALLDGRCIDAAAKLQRALAPSFARRNDLRFDAAEFDQLGVQDYAREFGHSITPRYFRELLNRALERDAGAENWARLEIYLPGQIRRRVDIPTPLSSATEDEFRELHQVIQGFSDPKAPSAQEEALLWLRTFEHFEALQLDGAEAKEVRRRLLRFLWRHAPFLAVSCDALRKQFDSKLSAWHEGGRAPDSIVDGRTKRRGVPAAARFEQESLDRIIYHTVTNCGGRVSQAVRELIEDDALDPQMQAALMAPRTNKSSIPHRLREAVRYDVSALMPIHQGRRATDKLIPSLELTYDNVYSMQCMQADDVTLPVYCFVPDELGWFRLTRGQLLVSIDWRSLFILGYCFYPEGQYNSGLIRTMFTRIFADWGIPEILYLERAQWKNSKLVTGGPAAEKAARGNLAFSDAEVEIGLRQYGVNFIHARRARSKPVERVIGLLQDRMEGEPSYCGRDERRDCPEITTRNKRLVELRQKHPTELGIYSFEQWEARIGEICGAYNAAPQNGKRLPGISPQDALSRFWNNNDPPTLFGPQHRFLLAHHKIPVAVSAEGSIKFRVRGELFKYFDAETGRRKGQKLVAWFNPEIPDICTFTNAAMRDAFSVERHRAVNGLVTDDLYEAEVAKAQSAAQYAKARYRILKSKFQTPFRPTFATAKTEELGRHIANASQVVKDRRQSEQIRGSAIRSGARQLGIPVDAVENGQGALRGLELIAEAQREHEQSKSK